jgi:hypothetical protein
MLVFKNKTAAIRILSSTSQVIQRLKPLLVMQCPPARTNMTIEDLFNRT